MKRRTLFESILADVVIAVADMVGMAAFGLLCYALLWVVR